MRWHVITSLAIGGSRTRVPARMRRAIRVAVLVTTGRPRRVAVSHCTARHRVLSAVHRRHLQSVRSEFTGVPERRVAMSGRDGSGFVLPRDGVVVRCGVSVPRVFESWTVKPPT
jgi:hypothetical protein